MTGILALAAYLPRYRLSAAVLSAVWGQKLPGRERPVAGHDEDSLTMAFEALTGVLEGRDARSVDGLFFATTTPPYLEKSGAGFLAAALDARRDVYASDFYGSLRSAVSALRAARDAVESGSARLVAVGAADRRLGAPGSDDELSLADAAGALLLGSDDAALEIEAIHSVNADFLDAWRTDSDAYVRRGDAKFVQEEGYEALGAEAVSGLLQAAGVGREGIDRVLLCVPDARLHHSVARKLGFEDRAYPERPLASTLGDAGTAAPLLALAAEAERLAPDRRALVLAFGSGCDAVLLRATRNVSRLGAQEALRRQLESGRPLVHYGRYLRFRDLLGEGQSAPFSSPAILHREETAYLKLYGEKCRRCGRIHFPPQRICRGCRAMDDFEDVRLSRRGRVFTYTVDHLVPTPDPPVVMASADLEGGGRFYGQVADCAPDEVSVGMEVELCLRRLHEGGGFHHYFWKMRPAKR
ncbi:MAG: OB-fold domain-containing protein [Candidatus Tectomicrobia bacterium]|nr:OB-fold domain-containing protein [Candidatus Tectomicrobia bacterium]